MFLLHKSNNNFFNCYTNITYLFLEIFVTVFNFVLETNLKPPFMRRLFCLLILTLAVAACEKEPAQKPNTPTPPEEQVNDQVINISIDDARLTAFQVVYSLLPQDKEAYYYCDVMSKKSWESANLEDIRAEFDESLRNFADMTGATYDEVCEQMLFKDDTLDFVSNAGYRPETEFVIFAFYWNDVEKFAIKEFTTPKALPSTESVAVEFSAVDAYSMTVSCEPTSGVEEYYYYFAETKKYEELMAELEDENAFISYAAMNVGVKYTSAQTIPQLGLKPETSYTVAIMAIDDKGNRMQLAVEQTTPAVEKNELVESELFESLLGEWQGAQTVTDGFADPATSQFTVTIVASVDNYDYDYRSNNQLVALVDGWNNIKYYGIQGLIGEGIENPEEKFGPKWVMDIAEGDVVTIDGQSRYCVIGWMFYGQCFMVSAQAEAQSIKLDTTLNVKVSDDGDTLTISSPLEGYYPSLAYDFTGFGWMAYFYGCSDIVLTRK